MHGQHRIRRAGLVAGAALLAGSALITACAGSASSGSGSGAQVVIGSNVNGAIPRDFNPFLQATVLTNRSGATGMIYEPLIQFNLAKPPNYYPWLATAFKWSDGGRSITFTIRKDVKFSNGSAMTPADVEFTYDL